MNSYNDNGEKHGPWEAYYSNGKLWYNENYINGKKHGLLEVYHYNGKLYWKGNYVNDIQKGYFHNFWDNKLYLKQYFL